MNLQSIDGTDMLVFLVVAVIIFFIQAAILRWIFMVKTHIQNQEATIKLLGLLCQKHGYDLEEINRIVYPPKEQVDGKGPSPLESLLVGNPKKEIK